MPWQCRLPPILRLAQALCCCLAFSTASAAGPWLSGEGDGCVAAWALAFSFTVLLAATEATNGHFIPLPRRDLPLALAVAAATCCGVATVLWPLGHLRGDSGSHGQARALRATAAAASAAATLCYALEAVRDRARPGETAPYMATPSGLLKVLETFVALVLLGLAAEQGAGSGPAAWGWCLGIYGASFAAGVLLLAGCLWGCGGGCRGVAARDPADARRALGLHAALGVAAYAAAAVLWPLYAFRAEMGGRPRRPAGCSPACAWDRWVLVAVLSALNLLAYAVDLVQTGRLVLLRA